MLLFQKCGIESLVDELCAKLKEINSTSGINIEPTCNTINYCQLSPQDSAKHYYAAFPPLSRKSSSSPSVIALIPKWLGSPKKKLLRRQNRSSSYDDQLHCKVDSDNMKARSVGKQRLNYIGRNKKDMGYCRNMAKSVERSDGVNDWDLYVFNNPRNKKSSSTGWPQNKEVLPKNLLPDLPHDSEQGLDNGQDAWINDDNVNMYEDLLDDIRELLNSPKPQEDCVDMMNLANMRDTGKKMFIQCGTNITSSIWSNNTDLEDISNDNVYNSSKASHHSDILLGLKFSAISIGTKNFSSEDSWPVPDVNATIDNETNLFFENCDSSIFSNPGFITPKHNEFTSMPWNTKVGFDKLQKWSEAESFESEMQFNIIAKSFMKLNHHKEKSSFTEVVPRFSRSAFNMFSKISSRSTSNDEATGNNEAEKDKEDLLTSVKSHFKPINEKADIRTHNYADGTSFVIPNTLDKVNYKRSESGTMYLDSDSGTSKKYLEYKTVDNVFNSSEFVLKFNICQNDKACQTDFGNCTTQEEEIIGDVLNKSRTLEQDFFFPGDEELLLDDKELCTCMVPKVDGKMESSCGMSSEDCPVHMGRPDSMIGEIIWKNEDNQCDKCNNNNSSWNNGSTAFNAGGFEMWQNESVGNIWNGKVCSTCLGLSKRYQPLNQVQTQLREDISHDGEQLLSDLSSLQKCYMEELPSTEITCNISDMLEPTEQKNIHPHVYDLQDDVLTAHRGSWSFASRLKEDCLIQMSTIPTLRSVTL